MKRVFYFTITAICFVNGCALPEKANNAENKIIGNQKFASTVNESNANIETTANGNKVTIGDTSVSKKNNRNWNDKNSGSKENVPIADKIEKIVTAAPDNSEISSQMNEKGQPVETRTFKKHPLLLKVERTDLSSADTKVYLKNGKVLNMPAEQSDKFLTDSAAKILAAVGVSEK